MWRRQRDPGSIADILAANTRNVRELADEICNGAREIDPAEVRVIMNEIAANSSTCRLLGHIIIQAGECPEGGKHSPRWIESATSGIIEYHVYCGKCQTPLA